MAAETGIVSGIAGRYATALFELAEESRELDTVAGELTRLQLLLSESEDLRRLVRSPIFSRQEQARAMAAILEQAGIRELVSRFIGVLAENRRLFVLEQVIHDFNALLARHRGETVARVISATPLSPQQMDQLRAALRDGMGREVMVDAAVDPALIGGLTVKVGSRLLDASIRSKLQTLKIAMKGVA